MERIDFDLDYSSFMPNVSLTSVISNENNENKDVTTNVNDTKNDTSIDNFFIEYNALTENIFKDIREITTYVSIVGNEYAIRNLYLPIVNVCNQMLSIYKKFAIRIWNTEPRTDIMLIKLEIDISLKNFAYTLTEKVRQLLNDIEIFLSGVTTKYNSVVLQQYLNKKFCSIITFNIELLLLLIENYKGIITQNDNSNYVYDTFKLETFLSSFMCKSESEDEHI